MQRLFILTGCSRRWIGKMPPCWKFLTLPITWVNWPDLVSICTHPGIQIDGRHAWGLKTPPIIGPDRLLEIHGCGLAVMRKLDGLSSLPYDNIIWSDQQSKNSKMAAKIPEMAGLYQGGDVEGALCQKLGECNRIMSNNKIFDKIMLPRETIPDLSSYISCSTGHRNVIPTAITMFSWSANSQIGRPTSTDTGFQDGGCQNRK